MQKEIVEKVHKEVLAAMKKKNSIIFRNYDKIPRVALFADKFPDGGILLFEQTNLHKYFRILKK
jgi:hypothetical protein